MFRLKKLLIFSKIFYIFLPISANAWILPEQTNVDLCRHVYVVDFIEDFQACAWRKCRQVTRQDKGDQCIEANIDPKWDDNHINYSEWSLRAKAVRCGSNGCSGPFSVDRQNAVKVISQTKNKCNDSANDFAVDVNSDNSIDQCWPHVDVQENLGANNCEQPGVGNPILLSTGIKYESDIDYISPIAKNFIIKREYNSFENIWRFNWQISLHEKSISEYDLIDSSGRKITFIESSGVFNSQTHQQYLFSKTPNDIAITTPAIKYLFDTSGRLISATYNDGLTLSYHYTNDQMTSITSNRGLSASIIFHPVFAVPETITIGNNEIDYSWRTVPSGALVSKVWVNGALKVQYGVNGHLRLSSKRDGDNKLLASWVYDPIDQRRVIQSVAGEQGATFTVKQLSPTLKRVQNPLGKWTEYEFVDVKNGLLKVAEVRGEASTNCEAANKFYSYDNNGYLRTQTDWKDSVTYYEYDAQGRQTLKRRGYKWQNNTPQSGVVSNVLSFLDAPSNPNNLIETITCWHSTHNQPERIIENDRVTIYDYFTNGQLKSNKVEPRSASNETCQ